jgi:hypothetical protein
MAGAGSAGESTITESAVEADTVSDRAPADEVERKPAEPQHDDRRKPQ